MVALGLSGQFLTKPQFHPQQSRQPVDRLLPAEPQRRLRGRRRGQLGRVLRRGPRIPGMKLITVSISVTMIPVTVAQ